MMAVDLRRGRAYGVSTMNAKNDIFTNAYNIGRVVKKEIFKDLIPGTSAILRGKFWPQDKEAYIKQYGELDYRDTEMLVDIVSKRDLPYIKKAIVVCRASGLKYSIDDYNLEEIVSSGYNQSYNPYTSKNLDFLYGPTLDKGWNEYFTKKYGAENVSYRGKNGWYKLQARPYVRFDRIEDYVESCLIESIAPREGVHTEQGNCFYATPNNLFQNCWQLEKNNDCYKTTRFIPAQGKYSEEYKLWDIIQSEAENLQYNLEKEILKAQLSILKEFIEADPQYKQLSGKFSVKYDPNNQFDDTKIGVNMGKTKLKFERTQTLIAFIFHQNFQEGNYNWNEQL
mgnify:CR=1 FL=1